jgi:hypothetical protein
MDLDNRQTRRLFLAGTVPFPTLYPSAGIISFESGSLTSSPGRKTDSKPVLVVQDRSDRDCTKTHAILLEHITSLFVPGVRDEHGQFRVAQDASVEDDEQGEWFFEADISAAAIRDRLRLPEDFDITSRESKLRGIAFVRESRPVVSTAEMIATAARTHDVDIIRVSCLGCGR